MAIGHELGKGVIALEIVPIGIGTAVGMCCRYQRPRPASTRFVKAAGVNTRKKINSLVFIMLCFWLMEVFFCKYTFFSNTTEKNNLYAYNFVIRYCITANIHIFVLGKKLAMMCRT